MLNEVSANLEHAKAVQLRLLSEARNDAAARSARSGNALGLLRFLAPRRSPRANFKPQRA